MRQSGAGSASSAIRSESGRELADQRQHRPTRASCGALVRRPECHQGVHARVAAHPLDVVARDQTAEAVADHVDPLVARLSAPAARSPTAESCAAVADVTGEQAVVERATASREAAPAQRPIHHGEDRVVVDDAVDQQDRRGRRVDRRSGPGRAGRGLSPRKVCRCRIGCSARRAGRAGTSPGGRRSNRPRRPPRWRPGAHRASERVKCLRWPRSEHVGRLPAPCRSRLDTRRVVTDAGRGIVRRRRRGGPDAAAADRRRQARAGRARPRREGRRPGAARCRDGGHLHRSAPDPRADRQPPRSPRTPTRSGCRCCPVPT